MLGLQAQDPSSPEARRAAILQRVKNEIAQLLDISAEALDPAERFNRYGLDSARVTVLIERLAGWVGQPLSPTLVWEYPTLNALAAYLAGVAPVSRSVGGEALGARLDDNEPIAIIGMACRFPGNANSPEQFWALLREGVDAIRQVPEDRWNLEEYYSEDLTSPGKMNTRRGGFLERVDGFDPLFFGISPREAEQMDPQQRLMLELSWEALEDAGIVPSTLQGSRAGVFCGVLFTDYALLQSSIGPESVTDHTSTGNAACIVSNRISYVLGLQGPSMTVDTACSSSLVAVHLACHSLRRGECSAALAGGVNLMLDPATTVGFSKLGAMSPGGQCRTFDAQANGYVRGEGGGLVVLKRLSHALRDGDPIYCVIRGSAVNNDGASNGLTAPNPKAQEVILEDACLRAGVDPVTIHYVEAHGTGTPLGDPIEASALGAVYGRGRLVDEPLLVGSVKTNIGHLEAAAGIAGLMKVALAMRHAVLPPNLHFEQPNPHIDFEKLRLQVVTSVRPWPVKGNETPRAGISSFGYGGTNSHVIVEGFPRPAISLFLGGESQQELNATIGRSLEALAGGENAMLRTLPASIGQRGSTHRIAIVSTSSEELKRQLEECLGNRYGRAVFHGIAEKPCDAIWVFSGQGSQWAGMGQSLIAAEPVFRAALQRCDRAMAPHLGWSVFDELATGTSHHRLARIDVAWPVLFALQVALSELWRAWGIQPAAVMGHSIGEVSTAYVAGVLTLEESARVICHQARLVGRTEGEGTMVLVALGWDKATERIALYGNRITCAIASSPIATVVSGEPSAMRELVAQLQNEGTFIRWIETGAAVHGPRMAYLADELPALLEGIHPRAACVPIVSTVTGDFVHGDDLDAAYWSRQLCKPVRFAQGIRTFLEKGNTLFLEVSPHPIIKRSIEECLVHAGVDGTVVASLTRGEYEPTALREALGALYACGVALGERSEVNQVAVEAEALREEPTFILPLSGQVVSALPDYARHLHDYVCRANDASLKDICFTASVHRTHHAYRAAIVARARGEFASALDALAEGRMHASVVTGVVSSEGSPRVVFVFPGQGSQWLGMGRKLIQKEPVFREALERCDAAIRACAGWSVLEELHAEPSVSRFDQVDVIQPSIFAIQIALAALWRSWGIEPDAVIGHSMGEMAAAHVAGVLSLEDAAHVTCTRARLAKRTSGQGAMAMIELPAAALDQVLASFEDRVSIAAINGPTTTVLSGEPDALRQILERLSTEEVFCRFVKVDYAPHNPQMDGLRDDLLYELSDVEPSTASVAIVSTLTGCRSDGQEMNGAYWFQSLREPVQFFPGVQALLEGGHKIFLEISPHPLLVHSLQETIRQLGKQAWVVTSLHREQDALLTMMGGLAKLHCLGHDVDFARLYPQGGRAVPLPAYPWQRERYWLEASPAGGVSPRALQSRIAGAHPLLGLPFASSVNLRTRFWEAALSPARLAYLSDHRVQEAVVLPGTAYLEMALAAAREVFDEGSHTVENVSFLEGLTFGTGAPRIVQMALSEEQSNSASFRISTLPMGSPYSPRAAWTLHATGRIRRGVLDETGPQHESLERIQERCHTEISGEAHYKAMAARGLIYGPAFQGVQQIARGAREALGRLRLKEGDASGTSAYQVHPALLDASIQMLIGLLPGREAGGSEGPVVPISARRLSVHQQPGAEAWAHVKLRASGEGDDAPEGDVVLFDASGRVLMEVQGLRLKSLEQIPEKSSEQSDEALLMLQWQRLDLLEEQARVRGGRWLMLADEGGMAEQIQSMFEARGESIICVAAARWRSSLGCNPSLIDAAPVAAFDGLLQEAFADGQPCRGVIHLGSLDITNSAEQSALEATEEDAIRGWGSVLHLVQALSRKSWRDAPRLWLVTRGAQAVGSEKAPVAVLQAPLLGLGRTIAYEHPELCCTRVDLSPVGFVGEVSCLIQEFIFNHREEEVALRPGGRYVARLGRQALRKSTGEILVAAEQRPYRMEIDDPGVLDRLLLRAVQRRTPGPEEVEIKVEAAGLNFIDVMKALGIYPDLPNGPIALGLECAGRIVALGERVRDFDLGQEVVAFTPFSFGSHVTTPTSYVVARPQSMRVEEAASLVVVFATAWYALYHIGRLQRGERILIHSAAGGTGLAAVQLAQRVGAEIFATAGTPEKRRFLREMGIEHIFDSRSLSFAEEVMAATKGEGVDVVLNSLSGEAIEKSLSILARDGRFLELGKRDIYADRVLGLGVFRRRLSYSAIDLLNFAWERPLQFNTLLREVMGEFQGGSLKPLPLQVFPISKAAQALGDMAQGQHIGKFVLTMDDERVHVLVPGTERSHLSPEGSYLITGGLGGLGLSIGRWMIKRGARHLVLLGRRGATTHNQVEALAAMRAAGAEVSVVQVDVSNRAQLSGALEDIKRHMPPLRGVVHAAGVLEDGLLVRQNIEQFRRVMAPKMAGALNLHALTHDQPLDFFVLYSSATSLLGSPGQGNYAAANASLDALAHHRRAGELPGLSINWGPFLEVGLAAAQTNRGTRLTQRGMDSLTVAAGEEFLERLLNSDEAQAGVIAFDARQWIEFYPSMASSSLLSMLTQGTARPERGTSALWEGLAVATPEQRHKLLDKFVREQLGVMLRIEPSRINRHTPLKSLGIDSLTGLDLRNRLESSLDLRLPATLMWTYPDLAALVDYLGDRIGPAFAQSNDTLNREKEEPSPGDSYELSSGGFTASSESADQLLKRVAIHGTERRDGREISGTEAEPIAIIGMGCRFPGGASDPEAFWCLLKDGVDAIREIPEHRWARDASSPERPEIRWAGLVDAIDGFDASFFGISPREAKSLDPQQRLLLEVTWEALENAGQPIDELIGSRTGVFVGIIWLDYRERIISRGRDELDAYSATGNMMSTAAGRLSYVLGLQGPCLAVDTACSSSLVAIHLACQSLRTGESDLALAGGVNVILSPFTMDMLTQTQALAPDGRCKSFDARANGFVRGEGCGTVVLKRLSDAERDGDNIWALIRGSAVNQDGRSTGLTTPNVRSQQSLLRQALASARVSPAQLSFIEAHGTGTSLGDPIEVEALKAVLGQPRPDGLTCALGSVKTNLGHLEAAAGIAGLMKVVLSLNHDLIPRHLHFQTLNPMINLEGTPFVIPVKELSWKSSGSRRIAGVSSFGISGTNAHIILEEAPQKAEAVGAATQSALPVLLPLSAKSPEALRALAQAYQAYLRKEDANAASIQDITYTASVRRSHYEHRLSVLGSSRAEIAEALAAFIDNAGNPGLAWGHALSGERPQVVFVFPGQGSQWLGMGRQLLEQEPVFGEALKACDQAIRQHTEFSVLEELLAPEEKSQLDRIDVVQPTLFAMGVALAALWKWWGVQPDAVVGHSMGEVGAAHVAGALSLADAAQIICRRSQLLRRVSGQGAMAVVELTVEEATERLRGYEDRVSVAVSNSPRSTVLSGDASALDEIIGNLESEKIFCRRVKVDVASHSPQMDPLREPLLRVLSDVKPRRGQVPIYSTVNGHVSDGADFDAAYWVNNLREPVQFGRAVEQLMKAGHSLFIEMSPHPILLPAVEQAFGQNVEIGNGIVVPSLRRERLERAVMLESLGALYVHGYPVDFRKLHPSGRRCVALPTYPWERQPYWIESSYRLRSGELQRVEQEDVPQRAGQDLLQECFYELTWSEQPRRAAPAEHVQLRHWLVLTDRGGVGAALAARLEAAGDGCTLLAAEELERGSGRIESVLQDNTPLDGVIHLGSLDSPSNEVLTVSALEAAQCTVCESVLRLLSLLSARERAPRLWLITRGAQPAGGERVSVVQAPLWGLGRVIALEHPELWGALIDLDPKSHEDEVGYLDEAIRRPQGEDQLMLRGGLQHVARLFSKPTPAARVSLQIRANCTYLITGGLGGLGRELARWLVQRGARHLVLTSRSGLPARNQWGNGELSLATRTRIEAVCELEALGAVVTVEAADVGDSIAMARAINASPQALGGVIHAAGIGPLQRLVSPGSLEMLHSIFQAKVKGTWVLHELTRDLPLDFFILFSSAASVWGGLGQGHYGAANQFLDAVAHYRCAIGLPATSINWGLWADGEMVTPDINTMLRSIGLKPMPTDLALEAMERAVQEGGVQRTIAWIDWRIFKPIYEARGTRRLLENISSGDLASAGDTAESEMKRRLKGISAPEGRRLLKELVATHVARALGFAANQPPPANKGFFTLGMDSITAVQLMTALGKAIGKYLPTVLAFEYPSIVSLAEHLADKVLNLKQSPQEGDIDLNDPREIARSRRNEQHLDESIAVIGIGCRFPGHANGPDQFWQNLENGVDSITEIPPDRWSTDKWFDPDPNAAGKTYSRHGGFLADVDRFDTLFFGIAPRDVVHMDPQHRLLLEVAWEALEHAGQPHDKLMGSKTGVFLGITNNDYARILDEFGETIIDAYHLTGGPLNFAAGRLAYTLGLQGPCMAVDTACSSSLVAAHLACQSLRNRECNLALACGVNLILSPYIHIVMSKARALSPTGRCRTFDEAADGIVRGEGCGVVVLKRLSDALEARDPILAIIRGSAVNQDGASSGLMVPNKHAQEALIRHALNVAGVQPNDVSYVEAHGTGTTLGDPIEISAIGGALCAERSSDNPLLVGSVKTNIGHTESAAGIAGLIKVVLALQARKIPPHLHLKERNPHVVWEGLNIDILTQLTPWASARRIAGVSSFGGSGTIAHMILEEAPWRAEAVGATTESALPVLLPLSAKSAEALRALTQTYRTYLREEANAASVQDIIYTASVRRSHHEHRLSVLGSNRAEITEALEAFLNKTSHPRLTWGHAPLGERPRVVFVFPGQGSQWLGMGRQLLEQESVFGEALKACDEVIRRHASFSVLEELLAPEERSQLDRIDIVQPTLFSMGVALAALWKSWGVHPDAVVGHSMGEVGAAYVAGALSLEDAAQIICRRSQLLRRVSGQGAMAVVELTVEQAIEKLRGYEDRVSVAVSNSPRSTVLSGDASALDEIIGKLEAEQVFCRRVKVDVASHSPQMDPLREPLLRALSEVKPRRGQVPICSTVSGQVSDGADFDAAYWVSNLREPVQFGRAVEQLVQAGHSMFIEMSPHPILLPAIEPMLRDRLGVTGGLAIGSLRREQSERAMLLQSLGAAYNWGYPIDWQKLYPSSGRCVPLPTYPWERQRYWVEGAPVQGTLAPKLGARRWPSEGHPFLGQLFTPAIQPGTRFWQTELRLEEVPYLSDHRVQEAVVLPGTAYLEMALSAARQAMGESSGVAVVEEVAFQRALVLREAEAVMLQVALAEEEPGRWSLRISSRLADKEDQSALDWTLHVSCIIRFEKSDGSKAMTPNESIDAIRARCGTEILRSVYYEELSEQGLVYGPAFQGVQQIWQGTGEALGRVCVSEEVTQQAGAYELHPALLDAAFQIIKAAVSEQLQAEMGPVVPVRLGRLRVYQRPGSEVWSHVRIRPGTEGQADDDIEGDVVVRDASGKILVEALGLRIQRLEKRASGKGRTGEDDGFLAPVWELAQWLPEPAGPPRGRWLLLGDETGMANAVQSLLEARGESVFRVAATGVKEISKAGLYRIDPASPEAFDSALQEASRDGVPCRGVIHLWSLDMLCNEEPGLESMESLRVQGCGSTLHLVQALVRTGWRDMPRLWLITRGTQATDSDSMPVAIAQAPLWGLGRTIAYEHPELRCRRVDLALAGFAEEASALVRELLSDAHEEEVALRHDGRYVGRLVRRNIGEMRNEILIPAKGRPFRLQIDEPGRLDQLILRPTQRRRPGPGEVEIQVEAASLNFIDVMKVLGIYPGLPEGDIPLGGECTGRVVSLGEKVQRLQVGQDVIAMAPFSFGTHITVSDAFVAPRPPGMSVEQAAAVSGVFMTAYYALYYLGRLQKGDRVLIHSAAGGVGLAAVQVARRVGAEIFATAGTPEKREYLRELGIEHVMDSRSLQFAEQVMAATQGLGIDVVLNSLSGQAIEKSLAILAKDGRFLELGKRDIYTDHRSLSLAFFRKRLSYHAVDLLGFAEDQPERFSVLLSEVLEAFEQGALQPLPVQMFSISEAEKAFRLMAQGRHIGKIVMRLDDPNALLAVPAEEASPLRMDGNYLITGGLGGLGLSVARWMVEGGARHVALIGRRGPTDAQRKAIAELESAGAEVQVFQLDISDPEQLAGALLAIEERAPLRGVVHAAAVLEDGLLIQQDLERLRKVMVPKVEGALNLHRLTRDKVLDFFVLYSSGASLLGSPGQGNYAAANTFLDALAHHRRAQGLPALSINWGPFSEVGLAAAQENRGTRLSNRGIRSLTPQEGVAVLGQLLRTDVIQIAPMAIDMRQWVVFYPHASSFSRLAPLMQKTLNSKSSETVKTNLGVSLRAAMPAERRTLIEQFIREQVASVVRLEPSLVERQTPFKNLGIDSLMGLELRNRLETGLGLALSATLIWTYPNVASLAEHLSEKLQIPIVTENQREMQEPGDNQIDQQERLDTFRLMSEKEKTMLLDKHLADVEDLLR